MPDTLPPLPPRDPAGHKGTFGTALIVGGCARTDARMFGAPALSARAALRSGVGLAKLLCPEPVLTHAIALCPSATGRALPVNETDGDLIPHRAAEIFDDASADADVIAIGPGLGQSEPARTLTLRALNQTDTPVVADADALNLLASTNELHLDLHAQAVLTPHPGEYKRLAETLRINLDPTIADQREPAAEALAQRLGCVVVLKGAGTVVSDGLRTWTCDRGHPCLATAGTGDVLTGVIAALIAQFVAPGPRAIGGIEMPRPTGKPLDLYDASRLAVQAHALAGELWTDHAAADAGMLAQELADTLPTVITAMRA